MDPGGVGPRKCRGTLTHTICSPFIDSVLILNPYIFYLKNLLLFSPQVANKQWATNHWPEWTTYNRYRIVLTVILTILLWPLYQIILWFTDGWDSKWRRRWTCPLSKYLHGIGSYVWFLGILGAQVYLPSRCLYSRYKFYVPDADCPSTGPPTIGERFFKYCCNMS